MHTSNRAGQPVRLGRRFLRYLGSPRGPQCCGNRGPFVTILLVWPCDVEQGSGTDARLKNWLRADSDGTLDELRTTWPCAATTLHHGYNSAVARRYYSLRSTDRSAGFDLDTLKNVFYALYSGFKSRGFFDEALGYPAFELEAGPILGTLGEDVEMAVFLATRNRNLWPLEDNLTYCSEADLFTIIEFLYDHVSKPLPEGAVEWDFGRTQYVNFDGAAGQNLYRTQLNFHLRDYGVGYELSAKGEVVETADDGFATLVNAPLPDSASKTTRDLVKAALTKFRSYHSDLGARRDAIRDLAAVLEDMRPELNRYLLTHKDDDAIFQIANNFAIRHLNSRQRTEYDRDIWYRWIFYVYLATVHAGQRAVDKGADSSSGPDQ